MSLLDVRNLRVEIPTEDGVVHAVQDVSFSVDQGQFFGVAGESGSGKSVLMQSIMGLLPASAQISGEALFRGRNLLTLSAAEWLDVRGKDICMIFQDPLSSLHPHYKVGHQITEQIHAHEKVSPKAAKARTVEMLAKVGIPDAAARFDAYPHQFSGGMRQRVMIAMALVMNPSLIIADEPTTALDSTVQAQILDLMEGLRRDFDTTIVMITHDLAVISRVADAVMVMYAGRMLEQGPTEVVFRQGAHPYTRGLMRSTPAKSEKGMRLIPISGQPPSLLDPPLGCVFAPRCPDVMDICRIETPPVRVYDDGGRAACWLTREPVDLTAGERHEDGPAAHAGEEPIISLHDVNLTFTSGSFGRKTSLHVLRGIDLDVQRGETIGLVGESGCGKSTLARVVAGLIEADSGTINVAGHRLDSVDAATWRAMRKEVQLVFQDPYGALNPRRRIGAIIDDPLRIHKVGTPAERKARVQHLMEVVGLNPEHYNRFPAEFSGGQRQRIGIARALALNPSIIIYDEPVSALDVSIQAQILNLMTDVQDEFGMTYLFISHDLAVVRHVCDRIAIMDGGRIIELAETETIYAHPQEAFTRKLLAASGPVEPDGPPLRARELVPAVSESAEGGRS
ncbi:MAG: ABC transporter ATP-binding protein [Dermatophilus congolensis]|nr:ABC transporter ATP-binding protein [Dermatophilus congolensis]